MIDRIRRLWRAIWGPPFDTRGCSKPKPPSKPPPPAPPPSTEALDAMLAPPRELEWREGDELVWKSREHAKAMHDAQQAMVMSFRRDKLAMALRAFGIEVEAAR